MVPEDEPKRQLEAFILKIGYFPGTISSGKTNMIIQKENQSCFKMNVLEMV